MLTDLEAVNAILRNLGTAAVTSLDTVSNPDVQAAISSLNDKRLAVQSQAWWFNTQENVTLARNLVDEIAIPSTTVTLDTSKCGIDVVQHGLRLFNRETNSYKFDKNLTDIWLVTALPWDDLPYSVREVVKFSAMVQVQSDLEGDREKLAQVEGQLQGAFLTMRREHIRNRGVNAFNNPRTALLLNGPRWGGRNPYRIGG
jgi:hypothetical protein